MPQTDSPAAAREPNGPQGQALAYVGLGGNLGDAARTLHAALDALADHPELTIDAISPFYRSAPVDAQGPDFINAVCALHTGLPPLALLDVLQSIEQAHHRQRPYRNAPRTLDLDLLWYAGQTVDTPRLTLPHPRMHERAFVLEPLLDLAPTWRLPQGELAQLRRACGDQPLSRLNQAR